MVPRLGSIDSSVWEPAVPRAGNPWFQDWEALVTTFAGHRQLLEPGTRGSKIRKDWFERLGTSTSSNREPVVPRLGSIGYNFCGPSSVAPARSPWFQDWEGLVWTSGNQHLLELGTWVPRLGSIGSNIWEPAVPRAGTPWFQDWEALGRTFGSQQFLELGARGSNIGADWLQRLGTSSS